MLPANRWKLRLALHGLGDGLNILLNLKLGSCQNSSDVFDVFQNFGWQRNRRRRFGSRLNR